MCIGGFTVYYWPYLLYLRSTIWGLSLRNETKMILAFQELFCFRDKCAFTHMHLPKGSAFTPGILMDI